MCVTGHQNLCDAGHLSTVGTRPDGTFRMHADGRGVAQNACLSTFSEWTTVPQKCVVRIPGDIPFRTAAIVGCAVPTGWGSSTRAADTYRLDQVNQAYEDMHAGRNIRGVIDVEGRH